MPTMRPTRRRQRRNSGFSAAELQYLDGQPRPGVSKISQFCLRHSTQPKLIDKAEAAVIRGHAARLIDDDRRDHLLAGIQGRRAA